MSHILQNTTPNECCRPLSCRDLGCPRSGETYPRVRLAETLKPQCGDHGGGRNVLECGQGCWEAHGGSVLQLDNSLFDVLFRESSLKRQNNRSGRGLSSLPRPHLIWKGKPKVYQMTREVKTMKSLRELIFICTSRSSVAFFYIATRWRQSTAV